MELIRDYEVSIWTLQDSFITVLKPYKTSVKGQIQNPLLKIIDDGTQEFSFRIPMYLYIKDKWEENPIWFNTTNGVLVANLRKVKVIFAKGEKDEEIFEFLITKVTDLHEKEEKWCEVECEGLAFHELGKIGYKISLSQEGYLQDWSDWADNDGAPETEPRNTINYWCNKVFKNSNWVYSIQMDWAAYDGYFIYDYSGKDNNFRVDNDDDETGTLDNIIDPKTTFYLDTITSKNMILYSDLTAEKKEQVNKVRESQGLRRCDKIYEDEYIASWSINDNLLTPTRMVDKKEKERLIDVSESNIYNITQTIAETFGVFCKYKYYYDSNYHIIKKEVIFYNNFLNESTGHIDITYPYNTTKISRLVDGTDTITKMFVKSVSDGTTDSGWATIIDTAANKTGEDYLLNFDYLYEIGTISKEQYDYVPLFEAAVKKINNQITPISQELIELNSKIPDLESKISIARNAKSLDLERISAADDLLNSITNNTGEVTVDKSHPELVFILEDDNGKFINLRQTGIKPKTIHVYLDYIASTQTLSHEIGFKVEYDEFNNAKKLTGLTSNSGTKCYMTYSYEPKLEYENVKKAWQERLAKDESSLVEAEKQEKAVKNKINQYTIEHDNLIAEKEKQITIFEKMMGPALREGEWQPDNNYSGYGEKHNTTLSFTTNFSELESLSWDNELLDNEDKHDYEITVAQTKQYYPCINLSNYFNLFTNEQYKNNVNFVFCDAAYAQMNDPRYLRYYPINSTSFFLFLRHKNTKEVIPVLMIPELSSLPEGTNYKDTGRLSLISTEVEGASVKIKEEVILDHNITNSCWISDLENYETVYPRVKINSLNLKTSNDELLLTGIGNHNKKYSFAPYEDYYYFSRGDSYYITIKPASLFIAPTLSQVKILINYTLSNAALCIYLDAIQVLKENAYPKVEYSLDVNYLDKNFIKTIYKNLNKICNINDYELKLTNVFGYISELELHLDTPAEDSIVIKNYKNKFEDLFSSIVAQTEEMKKTSYAVGLAARALTSTGEISSTILQNTINSGNLSYSFYNGQLVIDEKEGIWATSDDGVVAFRGGGIFTSNERDENGNWIWNTGILPQGINANLLTAGQIDTNLIKVYAGDNLKFQLNSEGLFAYKSWLEDSPVSTAAKQAQNNKYNDEELNRGQYVVYNSEGLFLVAEKGASVLDATKTQYQTLTEEVRRVEVSWDGLIIRNWNGERVFYADDNGNLKIKGELEAASGSFEGNLRAESGEIGGWIIGEESLYQENAQTKNKIKMTSSTGFNDTDFAKKGSIFLGLEGLSISNQFIAQQFKDGTFSLRIGNQEDGTSALRLSTDDEGGYSFELTNVQLGPNFGESIYQYLNQNYNIAPIYTYVNTSGTARNLPANASIGSLGVVRTENSGSSSTLVRAINEHWTDQLQSKGALDMWPWVIAGGYKRTDARRKTHFGIYSVNWNTTYGGDDAAFNSSYFRVGNADSANNSSAGSVLLRFDQQIAAGTLQLTIQYAFRNGSKWDTESRQGARTILLKLIHSGSSYDPSVLDEGGTVVGSGTFTSQENVINDVNPGSRLQKTITINTTQNITPGYYYLVFYSEDTTEHNLLYINQMGVSASGGSAGVDGKNIYNLYVKGNNGWLALASAEESL